MPCLTPKEAASLANKVYDVRSETTWNDMVDALAKAKDPSLANFDITPARATGKSGWGQISGFAYMANGSGTRAGESVVAIRGTATLADGLTDARVSFARSSSGHVVHRGFSTAFESIKPEIESYFKKINTNPSRIHIVGHSLGGALACMAAEHLSLLGNNVALYTFGCPRVGDSLYSEKLNHLIGINNINRVYHEADAVSMVPLYPFVPVSHSIIGNQLPWKGSVVSFSAHKMENYIASIGDSSWNSLPKAQNFDFFSAVDVWLEEVGNGGGTVKMFSCSSLRQILKALKWVLSTVVSASAMAAQLVASGAVIVVDVLAYLLYNGCLLGAKIAQYVRSILIAILKFLGRTVDASINISVAFIRFVLDMFFRSISVVASQALHLLP